MSYGSNYGSNNYGNAYNGYSQAAAAAATQDYELSDGMTISAADLGDYDKGRQVLPAGDYEFTVVDLQRLMYQPKQGKTTGITRPCTQIALTMRIATQEGNVDIKHSLYLWSTTKGLIAQYLDCVGLHKKGEDLVIDFNPAQHIIYFIF